MYCLICFRILISFLSCSILLIPFYLLGLVLELLLVCGFPMVSSMLLDLGVRSYRIILDLIHFRCLDFY